MTQTRAALYPRHGPVAGIAFITNHPARRKVAARLTSNEDMDKEKCLKNGIEDNGLETVEEGKTCQQGRSESNKNGRFHGGKYIHTSRQLVFCAVY